MAGESSPAAFDRDFSHPDWDEVKQRQLQRFDLAGEWIALSGMRAGSTVLDIGPGPGVFTSRYAKTVGTGGTVYALEKNESALDYLRGVIDAEDLHNVVLIAGDAADGIHVGAQLDVVMLTDVLHHADRIAALLGAVKAAMSPRTRLVIAEFRPQAPGLVGPPLESRLAPAQLRQALAEQGLRVLRQARQAHEHYVVLAALAAPTSRDA